MSELRSRWVLGIAVLAALVLSIAMITLWNYSKVLSRKAGPTWKDLDGSAIAREFREIFPNSHSFVSHSTGTHGPPIWSAQAILFDRYNLQVQIQINKGDAAAQFHLNEITSAGKLPDGPWHVKYGGLHHEFGENEWTKVYYAGGDLSAIGLSLATDRPVPNVDAYYAEISQHR